MIKRTLILTMVLVMGLGNIAFAADVKKLNDFDSSFIATQR